MTGAYTALEHLQAKNIEAMKMRTQSRIFAQEQMAQFVARVGLDLDALQVVHVAGSKGKGSTCAFTESVLRAHGFKTGLYASPHLISLTERFRINTRQVDEAVFLKHFWRVWDRLWATRTEAAARSQPEMPPYFTFLTLVGFDLFIDQQVDVLVLEVGLGGKLDATNIVRSPLATAVTFLALEHTEILGNTYTQIASEKAGIFKPHVPAITVPQVAEAMTALEKVAFEVGAPLAVSRRFKVEDKLGRATRRRSKSATDVEESKLQESGVDTDDLEGDESRPKLGLSGQHQLQNASLAISLAHTALVQLKERYETLKEASRIRRETYEIAKRACSCVDLPPTGATEALAETYEGKSPLSDPRVQRLFPVYKETRALLESKVQRHSSLPSTATTLSSPVASLTISTNLSDLSNSVSDAVPGLPLTTISRYQPTTLVLPTPYWPSLPPLFQQGLHDTVWAGRCQIVRETGEPNLTFYLDGAHTGPSIELCMDWFASELEREKAKEEDLNVLLFNCGQVRNPFVLLQPLGDPSRLGSALPPTPSPASHPELHTPKAVAEASKPIQFSHVIFTPFDHDRQYMFAPPPLEVLAKNCSHPISTKSLEIGTCPSTTPELAWQYTLLGAWHSIVNDRPVEGHINSEVVMGTGGVQYVGKCLPSAAEAVSKIRSLAKAHPNVRVRALVTGSLYLVGNVLKALAFKI